MPEAGASLLGFTTLSTEFGEEVESGKTNNVTYNIGGAVGFEQQVGRFLIDISPRYQYLGYEKGQFVSVRAAVSYILR